MITFYASVAGKVEQTSRFHIRSTGKNQSDRQQSAISAILVQAGNRHPGPKAGAENAFSLHSNQR